MEACTEIAQSIRIMTVPVIAIAAVLLLVLVSKK